MIKKYLMATVFFAALPFFCCAYAAAEEPPRPLEITADNTLEWKRDESLFIATGNAVAKQGESAVQADVLTAHYRDGKDNQKGFEIWQVMADRNVVITAQQSSAYGDAAVYDLDKGLAVMTGEGLRMVSPDQTVTAKERFEYWVTDGRVTAIGDARVERKNLKGGTDTLEADQIAAIMKDNAEGQRVLDSLEAAGSVVITTPTEVIRGTKGVYSAGTDKAELTGGVTIERGENILKGERAEVDLATNTSRLFGGAGKQVKGVFFPGSGEKKAPSLTGVR